MQGQDALKDFADALRAKGGVEARTAVLGGHRVEFVRGKDLVRWIDAHPEKASRFCNKGRPVSEQAKDIVELLMRRGLLARCERLHKKPAPGGKKLVKFPRKLAAPVPLEARTFSEAAFYAWTYDRPASPWLVVYAVLALVGVLLACLFPLAPYWIKATVFYAAVALLSLIMLFLTLRLVLAATSWILTGRTFWVLPNILNDGVAFRELFQPLWSVESPDEESSWANSVWIRASVGLSFSSLLFLLYTHSPKTGSVVSEASRYRDEIFDLLNIRKEGLARLTVNNETESS